MKKLRKFLFIAFAILLSHGLIAQKSNDSTSLPNNVLAKVWAAIQERDDLVLELNKKDSIITIYESEVNGDRLEISKLKLETENYQETVKQLEELVKIYEGELKSKDKEVKRAKRKGKIVAILEGVVILLLILKGV